LKRGAATLGLGVVEKVSGELLAQLENSSDSLDDEMVELLDRTLQGMAQQIATELEFDPGSRVQNEEDVAVHPAERTLSVESRSDEEIEKQLSDLPSAPIDHTLLAQLYPEEARQQRLLHRFVGDMLQSRERIISAYETEDLETLTFQAHRLKSSSRLVGALRLGLIAEAVEDAGKGRQPEGVSRWYTQLLDEINVVEQKISEGSSSENGGDNG
ncbi:MAG: Hpt domain-containing protein, partial [Gammaproteobacteria bacterium]|nr:Hpt domain-containing protein [Gammaproteobacteria bacterium]